MQISDERLTQLVTLADWMAAQTELGVTPEFSAALRELQERRESDILEQMTDEQRLGYFEYLRKRYCYSCGRTQPEPPERPCQCWRDE